MRALYQASFVWLLLKYFPTLIFQLSASFTHVLAPPWPVRSCGMLNSEDLRVRSRHYTVKFRGRARKEHARKRERWRLFRAGPSRARSRRLSRETCWFNSRCPLSCSFRRRDTSIYVDHFFSTRRAFLKSHQNCSGPNSYVVCRVFTNKDACP